jgi:putative glycosyltransferase (TIGR04348 family)
VGGLQDVRRVRIAVATPAGRGSHKGNRVTALRWAGHLRALGHRVTVDEGWNGQPCDVLVALHATKSHASVVRWRERRGAAPLVVGLAGTDLYEDLPASPEARAALALATRVTVLQPLALERLAPEVRAKARVIVQSAHAAPPLPSPPGVLRAAILAHLRAVKDPFLGAAAVRLLPPRSRWRVLHLGPPVPPRWAWDGDVPRRRALGVLAGSAALVVTSRLEGGSNVVSEAIAAGVPVLSTRVDGSVGVLGADYPGLFPVGDAGALAALLVRAEEDARFLPELRERVAALRPLVDPARERGAWRALLDEVTP